MSCAEFEALPTSIAVREVHLLIQQSGFRPKEMILVTTLVDPKRYPKTKLAELYQLRWQATEVNLRHLKTTLKMEMISAKTPEMVRHEIWMHLLAYNKKANLDVAICPTRSGLKESDFPCKVLVNSSISSDPSWRR